MNFSTLSIVNFANTTAVKGNSMLNGIFGSPWSSHPGAILSYFGNGIDPSQVAGSLMILGLGALVCFFLMKLLILLFKIGLLLGGLYFLTLFATSGTPADSGALHSPPPRAQHSGITSAPSNVETSSFFHGLSKQIFHTLEDLPLDSMSDTLEDLLHSVKEENKSHTF